MVERTSPRRRVCRQFSIPPEPNSKRVDGRHAVVNFNISPIYIEQTSKYLDVGTIRDDIFQIFQLFASIGTAFVKTFDESGRHAIINFNNLYLQLSIFRHSSWIPADMLVIFQLLVSIEPAIFTVLPTYSWTFNFWNFGLRCWHGHSPPFSCIVSTTNKEPSGTRKFGRFRNCGVGVVAGGTGGIGAKFRT